MKFTPVFFALTISMTTASSYTSNHLLLRDLEAVKSFDKRISISNVAKGAVHRAENVAGQIPSAIKHVPSTVRHLLRRESDAMEHFNKRNGISNVAKHAVHKAEHAAGHVASKIHDGAKHVPIVRHLLRRESAAMELLNKRGGISNAAKGAVHRAENVAGQIPSAIKQVPSTVRHLLRREPEVIENVERRRIDNKQILSRVGGRVLSKFF